MSHPTPAVILRPQPKNLKLQVCDPSAFGFRMTPVESDCFTLSTITLKKYFMYLWLSCWFDYVTYTPVKRAYIILSTIIFTIILSGINFGLKPYLEKRTCERILVDVLERWKDGDLLKTFDYWANSDQSPPIYNLDSYKIKSKAIIRSAKNQKSIQFIVLLEFPKNNLMPSGKDWVFQMQKTRYGWKIVEFKLFN